MTAKIKLNAASGGGSISIQAPSSSSNNRVISLPDIADGTLVTSQSTLDSTKLSPAIVGGKALQVVGFSTTTQAYHTGDGNYDETGLSAAITPASGTKILVIQSQQVYIAKLNTTGDSHINLKLLRDSTQLAFTQVGRSIHQSSAGWVECRDSISWNYLDTHGANGSTAVTYKTQYGSDMTAEVYVQRNSCTSTITLIEIGS